MKIDYSEIGSRIRSKRKQVGMTQASLAEASGIEPSNISHIERAATKLSLPTLISIANALNTTLDELVCGSLVKSRHIAVKNIDELLADCNADELRAITEVIKTVKDVLRSYKN